MMEQKIKELSKTSAYKKLIHERKKTIWPLTVIMLVAYYGFVLIIAFAPKVFAIPISSGVTSLGIASGLGLIFFTFIITGIYVRKANNVLEPLTKELHKKAEKILK